MSVERCNGRRVQQLQHDDWLQYRPETMFSSNYRAYSHFVSKPSRIPRTTRPQDNSDLSTRPQVNHGSQVKSASKAKFWSCITLVARNYTLATAMETLLTSMHALHGISARPTATRTCTGKLETLVNVLFAWTPYATERSTGRVTCNVTNVIPAGL